MKLVRLWKVLIPALGLTIIYTACKKDESATSGNSSNAQTNPKLSGVTPDDQAKLAKLPLVVSAQFYQGIKSGARKPTSGGSSTPTPPPPTDTTTVIVVQPTPLPSSYLLTTPTPGNQGGEGSCVAWATASARSIEQYYRTNAASYSYSTDIFSPEYIFNQIEVGGCSASAMGDAMYLVQNQGVCTWQSMPYSSLNGCSTMPTNSQIAEAANYKIPSYSVLYASDITAIKTALAAKHPLATTAVIDDHFYNATAGYIWNSLGTMVTTHAFVLVGYDDSKNAFKILNSWGTSWGDSGYLWVDYNFLSQVAGTLYQMN